MTFEEFRDALVTLTGSSFGIAEPHWLSRFGNATRLARTYRSGRVFLAGDAAHIHFPAAGQGLNAGLQDAMNLGWKLAAEINGWAPPGLLDTYHAERFPVGEMISDNTQVQTLLLELTLVPDYERPVTALRDLLDSLLTIPEVNARLAGHGGTFGYVDFTGHGAAQITEGWKDRITAAAGAGRPWAQAQGRAQAQEVGEVLVRPDGHIAWLRRDDAPSPAAVREAGIAAWAGAPAQRAVRR